MLPGEQVWRARRFILLALVIFAVLAGTIRVPYLSATQEVSEASVGEIAGSLEVGQTFTSSRPYLRGVAFRMATYSGRENTEEVIFELRRSPEDRDVLRAARVNARLFRDHEYFAFRFPSLPDSAGRHYYASLRSPASRSRNAITVEYSHRNPDPTPAHTLYLFREGRGDQENLARSRKPEADLAFRLLHDVSLGEWVRLQVRDVLAQSWESRDQLSLVFRMGAAAILVAALAVPPWRFLRSLGRTPALPYAVGALLIFGVLWRLLYATHLPFTNDEGTLLYDARAVLEGRLPGGDGVLKTPSVLGVLAGGLAIFGPGILTGRLVSIIASVLTIFPLRVLWRQLGGTPDLPLTVLWLLAAAPAIFGLYVHAQPVLLLFGISGLAACAAALGSDRSRRGFLALGLTAGLLFGLALGARKTAAAFALPALILVLLSSRPWRVRLSVLGSAILGFLLVVGGFLLLTNHLYGPEGVRYFLGLDIAAIDPDTTASREERRAALIAGVLPAFREALPLMLLGLVGLGGLLETLARRVTRGAVARLAWILPLALAWSGSAFLQAHERGEHFAFGLWPFWVSLSITLFIAAVLPRGGEGRASRAELSLLLLPLAWIGGLLAVYASWIKFTANYLAEFLPAVVLLAASGSFWLVRTYGHRRIVLLLVSILVALGGYTSARSGYTFKHTGTFDLSAMRDVAAFLRSQVPPEEPLLTAAVGIPVLSGHRVLFDIAHPTHYAYGYIEPEVRDIYLPPASEMVQAVLTDVRWAVVERLTAFSYFREYPEIDRHVEENFDVVAEFENLSNPITVLKRKRP